MAISVALAYQCSLAASTSPKTLTQTKMMTPGHISKVSKSESAVLVAYEVGDDKTTILGMCVVRCEWGCSHLTYTATLG